MQKKSKKLGERGEEEEWPLPPPQPYPWLLYFSGEGKKNQTFCSISDPTKTYSTSIPALGASRLCTVQHGWCLLLGTRDKSRYVWNLCLWNPYNLEKIIELPPLKTNLKISDCVLSSSPTSNDQVCSIFLFPMLGHIFYYGQLGDEQWTEVDVYKHMVNMLQGTSTKEKTYLKNPVYCNGCLYATMLTGSAYVFLEFETSGLKINSMTPPLILLTMPHPPRGLFQASRTQLLASNNQLFRIETLHAQGKVIAVAVYTFDSSLRLWEKVESIQDRVFFISTLESSPFACQAINPETEGGRIYIALKDSDFVCIYNIEDNSIVISQPFSDLPKERYYSTWFMPDIDIGMIDTVLKEEIGKAHQIREKESICGAILLKETETREEDKATLTEYALPLDMVEVISKCLGVFDYLHFRATNRHFRLAAPPVVQCRSSSSNSSSMSISRFDDLPLFVFSEKDKVFTFVHPKHGLNYKYTINLPPPQVNADGEFSNLKSYCEICYSKDGWLLLAGGNTNISFFFNPFTKEVLPIRFGLKSIRNTRCVGFSHPPTSSKRVIIELDKFEKHDLMIAHINGHRFFFTDNKFPLYSKGPTFHNGLFYYLSTKGKLAVLEVTGGGEEASWKEFEEPQAPPCSDYFNGFLVECDGNLLSVFEGPFGKWVQVFKLNESTMTWIKIESLENYMLFVSNTSSFSVVANIPGMENKIYFPSFYGHSIVFYSLETNNYHTFKNEVVSFHHVREHLNSSWIQPRWH